MKRGLVVRHHLEDDAGLIAAAFLARGFALTTVLVDADHALEPVEPVDAIVVLGSNQSVYDPGVQSAWLRREMDTLLDAERAGAPILGICFGAQMLCQMSGGAVERAPEPEIGWFRVDVDGAAPINPGPWFEYHGDRCVLPDEATLWAHSQSAAQAFTIGRHVGVQFHPEVDGDQLSRWFDSQYGGPETYPESARALLAETVKETPAAAIRAAELVDTFLAHVLVSA